MKRIGFIDFFLDEWHANNYPAWIRENTAKKGLDWDVSYAWADIDKPKGMNTGKWCEDHKVEHLSTIEELVEKSDYIIVLSPDNPENHERLSKLPLMSGKPVYIDKTFSPDLASGIRMFETAEKYNTPMFSSSALRFSQELSEYPNGRVNRGTIDSAATQGPGLYENYAVHQLEMIVSLMGTGIRRMKSLSSKYGRLMVYEYNDGRQSCLHQVPNAPFQVSIQLKDGNGVFIPECTDMFPRFIDAMVDFFATGKIMVPKEDTLEIMALIETGFNALQHYDTWIEVPEI